MTRWTDLAFTTAAGDAAELAIVTSDKQVTGAGATHARAEAAMGVSGFAPAPGRWLDLNAEAPRTLLLGASETPDWLALGGHLTDAMRALRIACVRVPASAAIGADALAALLRGALLHAFRLDQGRKTPPADTPLTLVLDPADAAIGDRVRDALAPVQRARAWVEQPANLLTPTIFADEARASLEAVGATVRVLDLAALEAMGAHGILAVTRGSAEEPQLFVAEWRGAPAREGWDAALVGKGLTYDSGGLNLKVRPVIEKMKLDMGGAAAVLGAVEAAARRKAAVNVAVVVPMVENSIGPAAYRPGDVIGSLAGLTIEVQNTDAEGRIILADGITYAIRAYAPRALVDVATLTGAITGVLHEDFAGLFTADDALATALLAASEQEGEPLWRLPLVAAQDYLVESKVADVANMGAPGFFGAGIGSPAAGAKFLELFARGTPWAHVDIAGTVWATRRTARAMPGATGYGVALLDRWMASLERTGA